MKRHLLAGMTVVAVLATACGSRTTADVAAGATSQPTTAPATTPPTTVAPPASEPVASETSGSEAPGTVEITAVDYGYEGVPDMIPVGSELTFTNASDDEVHEMVVERIDDDETRPLDELVAAAASSEKEPDFVTFVGVAVALPGEDGFTPGGPLILDKPGRYAILCFIPTGADPDAYAQAIRSGATDAPDVPGGPPHVAKGMYAELHVE